MIEVRWDPAKSEWLKETRGLSFEEIIKDRVITIKHHPTYAHQRLMLIEHEAYIWVVPFVESETEIFLKTLFRSRKWTRAYYRGEIQ